MKPWDFNSVGVLCDCSCQIFPMNEMAVLEVLQQNAVEIVSLSLWRQFTLIVTTIHASYFYTGRDMQQSSLYMYKIDKSDLS